MIPRIIHQSWKVEQVPDRWLAFQQSWREHHPDYEYRLWTDDANRAFVARRKVFSESGSLFDKAATLGRNHEAAGGDPGKAGAVARELSYPRAFAPVQMIGQRQSQAVSQSCFVNHIVGVEQDASVAAITEFARVQFAEGSHQIGLTMKVHRVLVGGRFYLIDPDGTAALGL